MLAPIEIDPKTFLRKHCTLPALPEVVTQIQQMIHDTNANMNKVADLVGEDPAILAQVLKVVNSAYYGLPTEITKVRMAVAYLGLNEVYRIVLSLAVVNNLAVSEKKIVDDFWFHSFFAATCAKHLAKKFEPVLSYEDLWPAAMLHDIGKLVYLKFYPKHFKALNDHAKGHGCTFSEAEVHFSLPTSAFLGSLLCDHWRLPAPVKKACACHTLQDMVSLNDDTSGRALERIICLSTLVALLSADDLSNETRQAIADAVRVNLNLSEEAFLAFMGDIYDLRAQVESFVGQFV
ncbi:MAG: HDOD domain-containing protein [Deltaproteobacteria bacterium]|nr:HDOD domain-containing protein [Deltaproteobacteria bacterium]